MFLYSKESSNALEDLENTEKEILRCIEASSAIKRPVFVAIKLSGLYPDDKLRRLEKEFEDLVSTSSFNTQLALSHRRARQILSARYSDLFERLKRLSEAAQKYDVHLVLDAELRYQEGVDTIATQAILCSLLGLKDHPVWNTHQMYFLYLRG